MIRTLLSRFSAYLPPPRIIFDRAGKSPYLSRWYLLGRPTMPDGSHPFTEDGSPKEGILDPDRLFAVFLHKFHRGDDDLELHNHPWKWAVSIVLSGGYREERRRGAPEKGGAVSVRNVLPFDINLIHHDTFHRVELLAEDAWSLFIAGPREKNWGFWNRTSGRYLPWREFITWRRDPTVFVQAASSRIKTNTFYTNRCRYCGEPKAPGRCEGDYCAYNPDWPALRHDAQDDETQVEVEVFASDRCGNDDCISCDGYAKRAEAGDADAHKALLVSHRVGAGPGGIPE